MTNVKPEAAYEVRVRDLRGSTAFFFRGSFEECQRRAACARQGVQQPQLVEVVVEPYEHAQKVRVIARRV